MRGRVEIVVFDMDGVLVDNDSSWGCVHSAFKVGRNDNLSRYLAGEIDFGELMRRDIRRWGRVHISEIERVLDGVRITRGAKATVAKLKRAGCYTAIISAGISILADRLQKKLGIDCSLANGLVADENGVLTGEGEEVVPLLGKVDVFRRLASERGTSADHCAVIGDSRFDIPLFEEAGISIAFNTSDDQVKQKADIAIRGKDLRSVLPYILQREK
ncbi:MAG: HAD family phosphatase [Promethearchaeati archaeon SRVP18_Atabeyarchaeia-1]